ncbi:MAG: hypothetical protein M3444_02490, partial [Acidobacteriota bacterium]|nr:hypothetical protein [Acidobacteriota bacterium]
MKSKRTKLRRTFLKPPGTASRATIKWQPTPDLAGTSLYFNGGLVARGAQLLSGGEATVTLLATNETHAYLKGPSGAALLVSVTVETDATVQVNVSGDRLYQGTASRLLINFVDFELEPDAQLVAVLGPGLQGADGQTDAPIPLQGIDNHNAELFLLADHNAALGETTFDIQSKNGTLATCHVQILSPLPTGNGLLKVDTLADAATGSFKSPAALVRSADGTMLVADTGNHLIKQLSPGATPTTVAGDGNAGNADGPALSARLNSPAGLALAPDGRLYIADTGNDSIRLLADNTLATLAGSAGPGYTDGPATAARFRQPRGLALAPDGSLFVADTGNHAIRKIDPDGAVSTVVGNGQPGDDDGPADSARLNSPRGLAFGPDGSLYLSDAHRVRVLTPDGQLRTLAGGPLPGFYNFVGADARFNQPAGLAFAQDRLVVADTGNGLLREVPLDGMVTTLAGGGRKADADSADRVRFAAPADILLGDDGSVQFCDAGSNEVRAVREADTLMVQVLSPPLKNCVTGDERILIKGRTNRPGAKVGVALKPESPFNQNLQVEAGDDGIFEMMVLLTLGEMNEVALTVSAPASRSGLSGQAATDAAAPEEFSLAFNVRSEPGLTDLAIIEPKDCEELEGSFIRIKLFLRNVYLVAVATVVVLVGIAYIIYQLRNLQRIIEATVKVLKEALEVLIESGPVDAYLFILGTILRRLPVPAGSQAPAALGDGDDDDDAFEAVLASKTCLVFDNKGGGSPAEFAELTDGQMVEDNRLDVALNVGTTFVAGDVNGVPLDASGVARGVPLTDATTQLVARTEDKWGQVTLQTISVRLADGVRPKQLLPEPLAPAVAMPGEMLTIKGPGLASKAESLLLSTRAGVVKVPVAADGPDQVQVELPQDALNGTVTLMGADDYEALQLNLKMPQEIPGGEGELLSERVAPVGRPAGDAYVEDETPLRVDCLPAATVGEVNQLVRQLNLRPVGARVKAAEGPTGEPWTVRLWFAVPGDYLAALEAFREAPWVSAAGFDTSDGSHIHLLTVGYPTSTSADELDWVWDLSRTEEELQRSSTWQLQFARFPAAWNLKAYEARRVDAAVADGFGFGGPQHEDVDVDIRGTQPPGAVTHGYTVSSVYGARHNGRTSSKGTDGANPLLDPSNPPNPSDPNDGFKGSVIYGTPIGDFTDLSDLLNAPDCKIRVVNYSGGYDFSTRDDPNKDERGLWYFNANYAGEHDFSGRKGLENALLKQTVERKEISKYLLFPRGSADVEDASARLVCFREARGFTGWRVVEEFYDDLATVLSIYYDPNYTREQVRLAVREQAKKFLKGHVVANSGHVATLPQDSPWARRLIVGDLRDFLIKKKDSQQTQRLLTDMVRKGVTLTVSAGNVAGIRPPFPKVIIRAEGPIWDFWWGPYNVPSAYYTSFFGYMRLAAADPSILVQEDFLDVTDDELAEMRSFLGGLQPLSYLIQIVGGLSSLESRSPRSHGGEGLLYAPSVRVRGATFLVRDEEPVSSYTEGVGTSLSSPIVSGLIAYLLALDPVEPADKAAQAKRLLDTLSDTAYQTSDGVKAVDAYNAARSFLAYDDGQYQGTDYYRHFARVMCRLSDGTPHGNDRPCRRDPQFNSGLDVEYLKGEGDINMADFRSFRDAYVQLHYKVDKSGKGSKSPYEDRQGYAMRLRDLNGSGAKPWSDPQVELNVWPRFDLDGTGFVEKKQDLTIQDISRDDVMKEGPDLVGSDLAYLASFWTDAAAAPEYEFVRKEELLLLLLSFDLRLTLPDSISSDGDGQGDPDNSLEELLQLARDENGKALSPEEYIDRIEFIVEDENHKYDPEMDKGELYRRAIKGAQVKNWLKYADDAFKRCNDQKIPSCKRELFLTLPLVKPDDPTNPDFLEAPELPERVRVRGRLVLLPAVVPDAKSDAERTLEFFAVFNKELDPDEQNEAACGWLPARLGGRYPVRSFQLARPRADKADPDRVAQDELKRLKPDEDFSVYVTGANLIPSPRWAVSTQIHFCRTDEQEVGDYVRPVALTYKDPRQHPPVNNTRQITITIDKNTEPYQYKLKARRSPAGILGESCKPEQKAEFSVVPQPTLVLKQYEVPGIERTVVIRVTLCIECLPLLIPFPLPPFGDWYPLLGGGPSGPSVGGSYGGGPPNGCGGWPGFYFGGGVWGLSFGVVLCFITITAVIHYRESDFVIEATVFAPDGYELCDMSATLMPDAEGLDIIEFISDPDSATTGGTVCGEIFIFRWRLRGVTEGLKPYRVVVRGKTRPLASS